MGLFKLSIYSVGAYQLAAPFYHFSVHYYNQFYQRNKQFEDTYNNKSKNKWAIVTGSSDGIGKAFAEELARKGYNVAISSRGMEKMQKLKDEISLKEGQKVEIVPFQMDYSKDTDYGDMVKDSDIIGNLSMVVNNVGLYPKGRSLESKPEDMEAAIKVNLYPIVLLSKVARNSYKAQHD